MTQFYGKFNTFNSNIINFTINYKFSEIKRISTKIQIKKRIITILFSG